MIPVESNLSLAIYSMAGKKIANLFNEDVKVGQVDISYDRVNLANGIYSIVAKINNTVSCRKLLVK